MTKRILIILAFLVGTFSQVYSFNRLLFKYENPFRERNNVHGYEFDLAERGLSGKDGVYRLEIYDDTCVAILIREANLLERVDDVPEDFNGLNVRIHLILEKEFYGYDELNFAAAENGFLIELNGKLMCESAQWNMFIKELIKYHQKYKKITHEMLKEILRNSGMKM